MFPLEFRGEVNRQETTVMCLSCSEDRMIVAWSWYLTVTLDRHTDRRTDRRTDQYSKLCWRAV